MSRKAAIVAAVLKSRRRWMLLSLGCLVAGVAVWVAWPRSSAINAANAANVQKGQTLAEVEEILGGPARDESTGPLGTAKCEDDETGRAHLASTLSFFEFFSPSPDQVQLIWISDDAVVRVVFVNGKARNTECFSVRRIHESPWVR